MSPPLRIGEHVVERLIERGAMAAVYLSHDDQGRPLAIKWLEHTHPPLVRRFEREVRALARLDHPGVPALRGQGVHAGRPFLVMDYAGRSDLRVFARKLHKRPPAERHAQVRALGRALCEVLAHLHGQQLIHRDLKPANVLLGEEGQPVLVDLGLILDLSLEDPAEQVIVGTPGYAAPEQLEGEPVGPSADLFGLGATLYYLLSLRPPFTRTPRPAGLLPPPPTRFDPSVPADLESAIMRCLDPDPERRPQQADELRRALLPVSGAGDAALTVPVAGWRGVLRDIHRGVAMAAGGTPIELRFSGPWGAGQGRASELARAAAHRRGLHTREGTEGQVYVGHGEGSAQSIQVTLAPLSLADVRRTVVAAAPQTQDTARVAWHLHRLTGGLPDLLLAMIHTHRVDAALRLPPTPAVPLPLTRLVASLDIDERDVLGVLAVARGPLDAAEIESHVPVCAEDALLPLRALGLVRGVGDHWIIGAQLVRMAILAQLPDPEGLATRVRVHTDQWRRQIDRDMEQNDEDLRSGRLAQALERGRRVWERAQACEDRGHACAVALQWGQILLDAGVLDEARRRLADVTTQAHALELQPEHRLSQVLRALVALEERPDSRPAAAAAADRVGPLLGAMEADPIASALGCTVMARALPVLGRPTRAAEYLARAHQHRDRLPPCWVPRFNWQQGLASAALGDAAGMTAAAGELRRGGGALHTWRADLLQRAADGGQPTDQTDPPDELVGVLGTQVVWVGRGGG